MRIVLVHPAGSNWVPALPREDGEKGAGRGALVILVAPRKEEGAGGTTTAEAARASSRVEATAETCSACLPWPAP